jgi:hypothetical protein
MRGYSNGSESTAFEISDLIRKPVKQEEEVNIFDEDDI